MSLHRSLRSNASMVGHRNVLTRMERIEKLRDKGKFDPKKDSVLGLPKVRSIKVVMKKKKKKDEDEAEAEA